MKVSLIILTALLATANAAFNKWASWGLIDYPCLNIFQGIPDHATVKPGQTIHLHFNREPTTHCAHPYHKHPAGEYSVWLYNNPRRPESGNNLIFDKEIKIANGIKHPGGTIAVKIPEKLPHVENGHVWYLRLDTDLMTAPQTPTIFNPQGPFTIKGTQA